MKRVNTLNPSFISTTDRRSHVQAGKALEIFLVPLFVELIRLISVVL